MSRLGDTETKVLLWRLMKGGVAVFFVRERLIFGP